MNYEQTKKEYVIEKISKGEIILVCNFDTKQMYYCNDMTIADILNLINYSNAMFFVETAAE